MGSEIERKLAAVGVPGRREPRDFYAEVKAAHASDPTTFAGGSLASGPVARTVLSDEFATALAPKLGSMLMPFLGEYLDLDLRPEASLSVRRSAETAALLAIREAAEKERLVCSRGFMVAVRCAEVGEAVSWAAVEFHKGDSELAAEIYAPDSARAKVGLATLAQKAVDDPRVRVSLDRSTGRQAVETRTLPPAVAGASDLDDRSRACVGRAWIFRAAERRGRVSSAEDVCAERPRAEMGGSEIADVLRRLAKSSEAQKYWNERRIPRLGGGRTEGIALWEWMAWASDLPGFEEGVFFPAGSE